MTTDRAYLPLTGLLADTLVTHVIKQGEIFEISHEIFQAEKFHEILQHKLQRRVGQRNRMPRG